MTSEHALLVRQDEPFNAETPLYAGMSPITPVNEFYVRSHFPVPDGWDGLSVDGEVMTPLQLSLDDLKAYPSTEMTVTMECAGNGRAFLTPAISGVAWELGAVGTATWRGTSLSKVLGRAGVSSMAVEVVLSGLDHGAVAGEEGDVYYERSLSIEAALIGEALLAYDMNGEPLPPEHGGPVRLIVPGWYGMASVKWLSRISAVTERFRGYYQARDYVIRTPDTEEPCRLMEVRAIITEPAPGSTVSVGSELAIAGYCWAGTGAISKVQASTDGGETWTEASVTPSSRFEWVRWHVGWRPQQPGSYQLLARGFDSAGRAQPTEHVWNERGYGNNGAVPTTIQVA